jgi:uncharacterized protein (DUF952 family)
MLIYKICEPAEWADAERAGSYAGSAVDRRDGFIHFSPAAEVPGTLAKYFADAAVLTLVAVQSDGLGPALKFETARNGVKFPHLYEPLRLASVVWVETIRRGSDGVFLLPQECV